MVEVLSVQDGDTFRIRIGEKDSIGVRILGVDVFESRRGERLSMQAKRSGISEAEALARGQAAKRFAQQVLSGTVEITRRAGTPNIDIFGRLLRVCAVSGRYYVEMLPDSVMVK